MDRIKEMLDRLPELGDAEITELEALILSEFESAEAQEMSSETVGVMTSLADSLDAVRGESSRRATERAALQQQAAEAAARVRGANPQDTQDTPNDVTDEVPDDTEPPVPPGETPAPPTDEGELPAPDAPTTGPPPVESDDKKKKLMPAAASNADEEAAAETTEEVVAAVAEASVEETSAAEAAVAEPEVPAEPAAEAAVEETEAAIESQPEAEAAVVAEEAAEETEPAAEASTEEAESTEPQEAAVTAAAPEQETPVIEAPADRRPTPKPVAVAITAGGDIPNVTAGSSLADMDAVAKAFAARLHTLRRATGGDGEQHIVASLAYDYPEDRQLLTGDNDDNARKIYDVVSPRAIVASGGFCAPLEQRYDFFELVGSTDRPVRDSLPKFQADRGGIRYTAAPVLNSGDTDYASATGVWTEAMDQDPGDFGAGTGNLKPCIVVDCPDQLEAKTEALTVCLQFGNLMTRAYPELVKRHNELAMIAHARTAEENLLAKIAAAGTAVTSAAVLGAARDYFAVLEGLAVRMRYRHRMSPTTPLRVIAPFWLRNLVRGDLVRQMPGDGMDATFNLAEAQIDAWFRQRNINTTWTIDGNSDMADIQSAGAADTIETAVEWDLFPEGTFLYLDGGTLDLGIVRDSSLVATNDYKTFVETFEGVAKLGPESLHVTSTLSMCGAAAALVDVCGLND